MSKNSSRNINKKLIVATVNPCSTSKTVNVTRRNISKNRLTNDILHNKKINKFVLEEDVLNFFPSSATNSSGSQSSWTDDLEIRTTKIVKGEFDLVERLLYGEDTFDVYNEEFDEWSNNFKYLRVLGSGIKLSNVRKTNETETEEIIAEHRDIQDAHFQESNYLKEIKNKIKGAVINRIIENAKRLKKQSLPDTQTSKNNRNERKYTLAPTKQERSFLPVRMEPVNSANGRYFDKQHPIVRSSISSAKWQPSRDTFDFPMLSSREKPSTHKQPKHKKFSPRNFNQIEEKGFTLPPIRVSPFQPDGHSGFFLRSNSCNTNKRDVSRYKVPLRTSSSRIADI